MPNAKNLVMDVKIQLISVLHVFRVPSNTIYIRILNVYNIVPLSIIFRMTDYFVNILV